MCTHTQYTYTICACTHTTISISPFSLLSFLSSGSPSIIKSDQPQIKLRKGQVNHLSTQAPLPTHTGQVTYGMRAKVAQKRQERGSICLGFWSHHENNPVKPARKQDAEGPRYPPACLPACPLAIDSWNRLADTVQPHPEQKSRDFCTDGKIQCPHYFGGRLLSHCVSVRLY